MIKSWIKSVLIVILTWNLLKDILVIAVSFNVGQIIWRTCCYFFLFFHSFLWFKQVPNCISCLRDCCNAVLPWSPRKLFCWLWNFTWLSLAWREEIMTEIHVWVNCSLKILHKAPYLHLNSLGLFHKTSRLSLFFSSIFFSLLISFLCRSFSFLQNHERKRERERERERERRRRWEKEDESGAEGRDKSSSTFWVWVLLLLSTIVMNRLPPRKNV